MKTYTTIEELKADVKNGRLDIDDSITINFSFSLAISITARDITAGNITAGDITAGNITAGDITAGNITAGDINAGDINAWDINAGNINAGDINAGDINAWNINARDIKYWAFCCVYKSIFCLSIKAQGEKNLPPVCLDGKLVIKEAK